MYFHLTGMLFGLFSDKRTRRFQPKDARKSWTNVLAGILLHMVVLSSKSSLASEEAMLHDLQALAETLPGCYSNVQQYHKHAQRGLPPHKRHFLIKSEMYKIASPMFNDSLTVYFQDFTKFSSQPFRSGFYSFSLETQMNVIRMRTFKLKEGEFTKDAFHQSHNFIVENDFAAQLLSRKNLTVDDLRTYSACDMFWKRLSARTFVGITGPLCLGSLGQDQVRIGVSMTLNNDKLLLTEGWYKVKDGTRISEVKVPYVLQKLQLKSALTTRSHTEDHSTHEHVTSKAINDIDNDLNTLESKLRARRILGHTQSNKRNSLTHDKRKNRRKSKDRKSGKKERVLRNFRQVAAALTSGYDVYYRVELSACTSPGQVKLERVSFGGKVKDFVFVRQDVSKNKRQDYLYFISKKTVMGSRGSEAITRQLTVLREGRVRVEITKIFDDPLEVKHQYTFDCLLYSDQKGYGGVKMAIDPTSKVRRITKFRALTSSVDQGRDLHVVADLARCQGSKKKPAVIFGSRITDYDFVNGGKTIEVYIPFINSQSSKSDKLQTAVEGFSGQFLKNGDVILTRINSQSEFGLGRMLHLSPAYHCQLSDRNAVETNDENEHSVKMFYRK